MYWKTDPCPDCGCEAGEPCDNSERMHPKFDTSSPQCPRCKGSTKVVEVITVEQTLTGEWVNDVFHPDDWEITDQYQLGFLARCTKCTWEQAIPNKRVEL